MRTDEFFLEPMLAPEAVVGLHDGVVKVAGPSGEVALKGVPAPYVSTVHAWLEHGRGADAGRAAVPPALAVRVMAALDAARLVVDAGALRGDRSGVAAMSRIEMRLAQFERTQPALRDRLDDPDARRRQLLGNAIEYYFVTLAACEAVAPALARVPGSLKATFAQFVLEEYRHDLILARALEPYGLTAADMQGVVPLPYTSAVTNHLFFLAHTDPLSLMACLYLLEGTPAAGRRYIEWLEGLDAPEAYVDAHREHDRINTNGAHGSISRRCLSAIEFVSQEDEERATQQARMLMRLMWQRSRQMVEYYDRPANPSPRRLRELAPCA